MNRFRFRIRDLLWAMIVVALLVGRWKDQHRLNEMLRKAETEQMFADIIMRSTSNDFRTKPAHLARLKALGAEKPVGEVQTPPASLPNEPAPSK